MPSSLGERDMDTKQTTEDWMKWLSEERHISAAIAQEAKLSIDLNRQELCIPVMNAAGHIIFSKFRRSPWTKEGPKYRYQMGSSAVLYGAEILDRLPDGKRLLICEGEMDTLVMRSLGYHAVSSTGGAMTWKPSWLALVERFEVVICYDADRAGVQGALKVSSLVPKAKIAWLPVDFGKDPTDIISNGGEEALHRAILAARRYDMPHPEESDDTRLSAYIALQKVLREEVRECLADRDATPLHRNFALDWLNDKIEAEKEIMYKPERRPREGMDRFMSEVEQARAYPIARLVKLLPHGQTYCVYHEENTASMKVYRDNHAFSYCCSKRSDAIDIYMAVKHVDFKTAVKELNAL